MKKFMQKKLKNEKGMTLIELLAVIVILAIIAAIAIPAIGNIIDNSRVGAMKSDALNIIAAAELYYADNPDITTAVTVGTLATGSGGYLEDNASFPDTASVTTDSLISGAANISTITVTFTAADRQLINSMPNNTADAGGVGNATNGITVDR